MSSAIRYVAIAGAAGSLGSVVFGRLVESGKFQVRVLRRKGSGSTFPSGTDVVDVDFDSFDSLKGALAGQDAVVAAFGPEAFNKQPTLIDAAIAAGVQRFLPAEFGSNLNNALNRALPPFAEKVKVRDYLADKAKTTALTYTLVSNGPFLDWGLDYDFLLDVSNHKAIIVGGGETPFSTTTLQSVADAMVGVFENLEETKNRAVFIEDIQITQNKLLALAKEATPDKEWKTVSTSLDALTQRADERLAQGLFDIETFGPYILRSFLDPAHGGNYSKTDNQLLGVKGKTEKDVVEIVKHVASKK
ncbi:hypothetical protein HIM_09557 [Hirsutella minnesotensis 3608]|uniref:NAD(P)-binding domain-containing protein n=1 Tax=Hirsutella minnesotensis 3608 TaxID=1043627 RepID=A0A0F7ZXP0_9HYPO|nr:hypothetical protein HIM_09557 [Hirsutella minnesotensis 3608]